MICRNCKRAIPEQSIYCNWCGEKQIRDKRQARYPKYRVLADGTILGQLMVDGRRVTIKGENEAEYKARVDAYRTHIVEIKACPERRPLAEIIRGYIDKNDGVLSPSTIRGYETLYSNRFKDYLPKEAGKIDYQKMINDEAKKVAPKTVRNGWALVTAALNDAKIPVPDVNLPAVPESNEDFLDYEQIQVFLEAIRGDPAELAALLMLHSLRMSEALRIDAREDISGDMIQVRGAVVPNKEHKLVEKKTNKTKTSARSVPIMIPRLKELLPEEGKAVTLHPSTIRTRIEKACIKAGLPVCSPHDLRRSFASLGYHLKWMERTIMVIGGWNDINTVHKIYVKLAQKDINRDVEGMRNYYGFTITSKNPRE